LTFSDRDVTATPLTPAALRPLSSPVRAAADWFCRESGGLVFYLLAFVVCWSAYQILSNISLGLHSDFCELYDWSRHLTAGYVKHPPLGAFITRAWLTLFPVTDWSLRLMAIVYAAMALFAIYLIARHTLAPQRRLPALLLLLLTPFYQFLSDRFGANQVLLLVWPLATYCFLRAFETRDVAWSMAAGAAAALALLGKYYSIYLVGSFVLAALIHPARLAYLRSSSPWVSAATGMLVLSPHIRWLFVNDFRPFGYALTVHATSRSMALRDALTYMVGACGYVSGLVAVWWLVVRPSRALLRETLWPSDPGRRMLVVLLAGQILMPPLTSVVASIGLTALWTMQAWFLLPIVLLSAPAASMSTLATRRLALGIAVFTLAAIALAPAIAWFQFSHGTRDGREYFPAAAQALEREWETVVGAPLRIVAGDDALAVAVAFYARSHPDAVPYFNQTRAPWVRQSDLGLRGWAALCASADAGCMRDAESTMRTVADVRHTTVEIAPHYLGAVGKPRRFSFWIVPPHATATNLPGRTAHE
jgi:4-amino-4-deoxy-L-arabinose transferase-like glycosyltransferase